MINYQELAQLSLQGIVPDREQCRAVLRCSPDDILDLLRAAFIVRKQAFGKKVILQLLINAKSGLCTEDCAYCSQSAVSDASIPTYPLLDEDKILDGAFAAKAAHARRYCIVTSGFRPGRSEIERLGRIIGRIKREVNIEVCASLGCLAEEDAVALQRAGLDRYNHNLNTSERMYPRICTTHGYTDRVRTLEHARSAGLKLCCGALFGMGETDDDIIDLAFALTKARVDSIPVNFLNSIEGTALEAADNLTPVRCLAILCLLRFLNPWTEIRAAGGREVNLRSLQSLALYPANSIFVAGYLTTGGQGAAEARQMITDAGFEVEEEPVQKSSVL